MPGMISSSDHAKNEKPHGKIQQKAFAQIRKFREQDVEFRRGVFLDQVDIELAKPLTHRPADYQNNNAVDADDNAQKAGRLRKSKLEREGSGLERERNTRQVLESVRTADSIESLAHLNGERRQYGNIHVAHDHGYQRDDERNAPHAPQNTPSKGANLACMHGGLLLSGRLKA